MTEVELLQLEAIVNIARYIVELKRISGATNCITEHVLHQLNDKYKLIDNTDDFKVCVNQINCILTFINFGKWPIDLDRYDEVLKGNAVAVPGFRNRAVTFNLPEPKREPYHLDDVKWDDIADKPAQFPPAPTATEEHLIEELEIERMRLVACGVVALADTPESAKDARNMHKDYMSASCEDVARRVDECIALRAENADLKAALKEMSARVASGEVMASPVEIAADSDMPAGTYAKVAPPYTTPTYREVLGSPNAIDSRVSPMDTDIVDIVMSLLAYGYDSDLIQDPVAIRRHSETWSPDLQMHIRLFHQEVGDLLTNQRYCASATEILTKFCHRIVDGVIDERSLAAMRLLDVARSNDAKLNNNVPNVLHLMVAAVYNAWKLWLLSTRLNPVLVLELGLKVNDQQVYIDSHDGIYGNLK